MASAGATGRCAASGVKHQAFSLVLAVLLLVANPVTTQVPEQGATNESFNISTWEDLYRGTQKGNGNRLIITASIQMKASVFINSDIPIIEGQDLGGGVYPTLDCVQSGTAYAFVITTSTSISGLDIGGCISGAMSISGATVTLSNVKFRNNNWPNPGNALLLQSNAVVTASGLEFDTNVGAGPTASLIHIDSSTLTLTKSTITKSRIGGPLITAMSGTLQADALTIDDTNEFQGTDVVSLSGCAPGGFSSLNNSRISGLTNISSIIRGTAGSGSYAGALPGASSPRLFAPLDRTAWSGCGLTLDGTVIEDAVVSSALVATTGYVVEAKGLTLTGNSEVEGLPDGTNATLLDVEGGWLRLDSASITGNQVRGIALRVTSPAGPTTLRTTTISRNAAQSILYVEGAPGFADSAAWEEATRQLPPLAFSARPLPPSRAIYREVKAAIARLEAARDRAARGAPLLLSGSVLSANDVTGSLIQGDGAGWDSGTSGDFKGLTVVVEQSQITGNTAAAGGLLETAAANVTLSGTSLVENTVGATAVSVMGGGVLRLTGVVASGNNVQAGPLVYGESLGTSYVRGSQFVNNNALDALLEIQDADVAVTGTKWAKNAVVGNVVSITDSEVVVDDFEATDNIGQVVLRLDLTPLNIRNAVFTANSATGLLALSSAPLWKGDKGVLTNVSFAANIVNPQTSGTAVISSPNPALPIVITGAVFDGNTIQADQVANATGGLFLSGVSSSTLVTIASSTFKSNTGATGGAIWTARSTLIDDSVFTSNIATYTGGAVYAEPSAQLTIPPTSTFRNNTAPSGGALTCQECAPLSIDSATFIENTADASLEPAQAPITGAPDIPCGAGSGGAVCLVTSSSKATITNTTFYNNTAELGGGLYLDNSCGSGASASAACNITLDRMELMFNNASAPIYADIYLTSDAGVTVCCLNKNKLQCDAAAKLQDVVCAVKGIGGLATTPVAIKVESPNANSSVVSGSTILSATVSLVDDKGQVVAVAPGGLRVDISSNSRDLIVVGNTSVPFNNDPSISITNFQVLPNRSPDNSEYQIFFKATGSAFAQKILPGSFNITIPQCTLGEYEINFRCLECGQYKGQYSLDPRVRCEPCPPSGNCSGGFLVPRDGFWQPNPLVPQLQECPLDGGCSRGASKDRALMAFMQGLARSLGKQGGLATVKAAMQSTERQFTSLQCGRGYMGRLCGVCAKGFGRWSTRCVKCASRAVNNFYVFLALLFLVFIMSITLASHLRAALYKRPPPPPPPQEEEAEALDKRKVYDLEQILAEQARKKLDARLDADQVAARQKEEAAARQLEEAATNAERSSLHFSMLTALAKIMVSYVQVIGMARALELNIPRPLRRFLSNFDYTSSLIWLSLDCSLHGSSFAKAVKRSVFTVCLPLILMAFFSAYWYYKYLRRKAQARAAATNPSPFASSSANGTAAPVPPPTAPRSFLANRLITTFLQVAFYTYPLVTATLFHLFDCRKLRKCTSEVECQYRGYNPGYWKTGWYWTQSYSTPCFKGNHLPVMLGLGIPGIAIFSIGVPLLFGLTIWSRRSKLQQPRVLLRFGFLYWEYRQRCHYWEAVITARKLGLLMTTIFLRYTGKYAASIQIYTSLMVLLVAILLQEALRPFEDELLNRMERLSLFASVATFVLMAYYLVGPISPGVRLALAAIIMALNLACLLQFISLILWELWLWMLDKLGIDKPSHFRLADIGQVSSRLRGRWKDVRSIIVNDFVMPSMVSRLTNRQPARGNQLPAPIPTQEDIHP